MELLIAIGVFGLVSAAAVVAYLQALNIYCYDAGKIQVNRDIRAFTQEMTTNATYANYFLIYPNYSKRSNTVVTTDPITNVTTTTTVDAAVNDGMSGDFLVLVFKDDSDDTKIARLIGYYRAPSDPNNSASKGPVRHFDLSFSPSSSKVVRTLLDENMPSASTLNTNSQVFELTAGLADGKLFYNFYDRSVMIKGQIEHRGSLTRQATNTYNFTVSPRG